MYVNSITEAKAQLSALIARVERGEEVIIARAGKPVVKMVSTTQEKKLPRVPGRMKGKMWMSDDFDEWPEDIARALWMID